MGQQALFILGREDSLTVEAASIAALFFYFEIDQNSDI